jgi:hypothetical protein
MCKYPKDVWEIHPLVSDIQTKEELDKQEKYFIGLLSSRNHEIGYNICKGGEGFTGPHTEEWKKNHSAKMKGRVFSPESIARMKAAPKSVAQLNNLKRAKDPDVIAKRIERYVTDPTYRLKISEASKKMWAKTDTAKRIETVKRLTEATRKRWDKYRKDETLTSQVVALRQQGMTHRAIAHKLGIGKSTVHSHLSLLKSSQAGIL